MVWRLYGWRLTGPRKPKSEVSLIRITTGLNMGAKTKVKPK